MAWGAVAGAVVGAGASIAGQYFANKQARGSVNRQIAFQREAYQHRYQWQMNDMRAAGLNPILSYSQGPPAGPSGASYTPTSVTKDVDRYISTAIDAYRARDQVKQARAATENLKADSDLKRSQQQNVWADTQLKNAQAVHESTKVRQTSTATDVKEQELVLKKLEQILAETRTQLLKSGVPAAKIDEQLYKTGYGKFLRWLDQTGRSLNPFASSAKSLRE